jgi:rhamnulokinase
MTRPVHAAIDLGAGSGRVLVGGFSDRTVRLEETHRFSYRPRPSAGHLRWDVTRLFDGVFTGLGRAVALASARGVAVRSIGVDSWGVDYGLVDHEGRLIEEPICYRDPRTGGVMDRAFSRVPRETLFRRTGIQFLPFNTVFQLMAHAEAGIPSTAARLLMIPDLCHQRLCGSTTGEHTNASTTGLLNVETSEWDDQLFAALRLARQLMPPLQPAGVELGVLSQTLQRELALGEVSVVQPATHDTASAVAGTPLGAGWAFISSGTWSLVGVERTTPLLADAVLDANFTNERGACGTFRFLKNVAGLWILESCRREWQAAGLDGRLGRLLAGAAALRHSSGFVDPDAPRFFNPPSMLRELRTALEETGQRPPTEPAALTRVILDSLALRYASVVDTLETLTGEQVAGVHIVGGGARNDYLNQATANATGRPVLAGPVEATGLGNMLMQAVACGLTTVDEGRRRIAETFVPRRFEPIDTTVWRTALRQYQSLERENSWRTATTESHAESS